MHATYMSIRCIQVTYMIWCIHVTYMLLNFFLSTNLCMCMWSMLIYAKHNIWLSYYMIIYMYVIHTLTRTHTKTHVCCRSIYEWYCIHLVIYPSLCIYHLYIYTYTHACTRARAHTHTHTHTCGTCMCAGDQYPQAALAHRRFGQELPLPGSQARPCRNRSGTAVRV